MTATLNHTLHRTQLGRRGCKPHVPWAASLSMGALGHSAMRLLLFALLFPLIAQADEAKRLPANGLGFDFVLTGLADIPLGQTFEIEATAVPDPERDAPKGNRSGYLKVIAVNGRKLKEPEEIPLFGSYKVPQGIVFRLTVIEDARYELFTTPNLSIDEDAARHTRQRMVTGLRIVKQLAPTTPELREEQAR